MNGKKNAVRKYKQKRNNYLLLLGILAAIAGLFTAILAYYQSTLLPSARIVFTFAAVISIYLWIVYDAKIHNYSTPQYLKILIILLPFLGLPIYFWHTRNFTNFLINIGGLWLGAFYNIIYFSVYAIALSFL